MGVIEKKKKGKRRKKIHVSNEPGGSEKMRGGKNEKKVIAARLDLTRRLRLKNGRLWQEGKK